MANAPRTGHILMHHPTLRRQRASARQLAQRALYSRNPRVVGHCVLLCGVGCCLWTRGFSGRRGPAVGPGCLVCPWPARDPPAPQPGRGPSGARRTGSGGGFALHEAFRGCVAGVSEPHVVQSPPIGGTPSLVLVGVAPTVQTTSANTSEHGLLSARWSALRAQQRLSWRTTRR